MFFICIYDYNKLCFLIIISFLLKITLSILILINMFCSVRMRIIAVYESPCYVFSTDTNIYINFYKQIKNFIIANIFLQLSVYYN